MKTTLGGDRIGSGSKNQISLRNYERSTHDLSYTWRSTIAPGTLVPFMSQVALPGDTFDIDLNLEVNTLPTIGELFGSFKVEAHVFSVPMRLYNAKTNINMVNIGLDMKSIKLPKIELLGKNPSAHNDVKDIDNYQINSSSLFKYLGISGLGYEARTIPYRKNIKRKFNAIPFLAYWDIFKNYYANKQEERAYVIHNKMDIEFGTISKFLIKQLSGNYAERNIQEYESDELHIVLNNNGINNQLCELNIEILGTTMTPQELRQNLNRIKIYVTVDGQGIEINKNIPITDLFENFVILETVPGNINIKGVNVKNNVIYYTKGYVYDTSFVMETDTRPQLHTFPLEDIDKMKMKIFSEIESPEFNVKEVAEDSNLQPYSMILGDIKHNGSDIEATPYMGTQEGLALKTYSSDKFNNWIDTEWIDGDNGIAQITAVKVDEINNTFTIDELNLANKVYNMLMRIAVSGGTYDDYLEASYDHERVKEVKSPVYEGGLIRELVFQEVVSTTENENISLGTVVGRGVMTDKRKGGKMVVRVNEPSYIMGIISITPRVDYSQGNSWDVNLDSLDDLHKPGLDEIGFQDLITDEMAWFDTEIDYNVDPNGKIYFKSAGKVPAWQNYMTNVNQLKGNFANSNSQMWMTLNRKYNAWEQGNTGISDLTTYIDPTKFNYIFADTRLDAQNFMVHMGIGITARRKMSAKVMPNL